MARPKFATKQTLVLNLLEDSYFGTGGFEYGSDDSVLHVVDGALPNGAGSYLIKHPRETPARYRNRQAIAYYLNYMAPVVDSHVVPLFRKDATITGKTPTQALWDAFAADATGGGKSLSETIREAAFPAKRDGIHVLVVTAPPEQPATVADALTIRPYIYGVAALDVVDLKRDKSGRIVSFSHLESRGDEVVTRLITPTGWSVSDDSGVPLESGTYSDPYPYAPVVELSPGLTVRGQMLPRSEFVGVARANHRLFNACSELDEIFRGQTFSLLIYPAKDVKSITTGVSNMLGYDPEYKMAPAFIAPPDGPAKVLMEQIDRIIREIYRMSLLTHQTGTTGKSTTQNLPSGIALKIDRESLDSSLSEFGKQLETAVQEIGKLWSWWTGETLALEVSYPREFTLQDLASELQPLLDSWAAIASTAPKILRAALLQRIADLLLEDDDLALEEVEAAIEEWGQAPDATPPDPAGFPPAGGADVPPAA